jgi:hypothetical protein
MQHNILAACDDIQRVKLHRFTLVNGLAGPFSAFPTTTRPESLLTENKTAGNLFGNNNWDHQLIWFGGDHQKAFSHP